MAHRIAHEYGNKLNIDIYDDARVLDMMNEIDKLNGKKLSKTQYKKLSRHYIAMYISGMEDMVIEHELSFFPSDYYADPQVKSLKSTENHSAD